MFIIYNLIYLLFIVFYFPSLIIKQKFHKDIFMRLGVYPKGIINRLKGKRHIWLHAVSVGEMMAAARFIAELKKQIPELNLVISTVTVTGNKVAKSIADKDDVVIYLPLDFDFIIRRAINLIKPSVFITVETEFWPKLINRLYERGVPVILANGRISEKSFRGYKRIGAFTGKILEKINLFCAQTEKDAQRLIDLGASPEKIKITGNMKFDLEITRTYFKLSDLGLTELDMLFLAGSTHQGEEEIILKAYKNLISEFPNLKLLIAPRHVERSSQIDKLIKNFGFKVARVSQIEKNILEDQEGFVYLLDTVGLLQSLYSLATIVFVGGSLVKKGGQNIIEPAIFGKPILFGPHTYNFYDIVEFFINGQAAIQIDGEEQLQEEVRGLLGNQEKRDLIGRKAKEIVQRNRGTVERTFNFIKDFLK